MMLNFDQEIELAKQQLEVARRLNDELRIEFLESRIELLEHEASKPIHTPRPVEIDSED